MRMALLVLVALTCATPFVARADAPFEMSDDGLYRRESRVFEQLRVRKHFDVRSYHAVMFAPSFIQYRPPESTATASVVTPRQKELLQEIVDTMFREELAKSQYFALANAPGPDVMMVRGDLLDVVSYVPGNASAESDQLTVPAVGEAILVLELHDSITSAIMVRASNHVAAKSNQERQTADQAVRATVQSFAMLLRENLDAAASIPEQ
jgi:hypothetical protein